MISNYHLSLSSLLSSAPQLSVAGRVLSLTQPTLGFLFPAPLSFQPPVIHSMCHGVIQVLHRCIYLTHLHVTCRTNMWCAELGHTPQVYNMNACQMASAAEISPERSIRSCLTYNEHHVLSELLSVTPANAPPPRHTPKQNPFHSHFLRYA